MTTLWIFWAILTAVVIGLALYRKFASHSREDELVYLAEGESPLIPKQVATARSLERIDYRGRTLTVVDLVFGATLLVIAMYDAWQHSLSRLP